MRAPALALALWAGLLLLCHLLWGWVPILDAANLAFHEAGHPVFGLVSARLAVYGGTLMQLAIPAACALQMQRQRMRVGAAACLIWFGESLLNVARYMADARAQALPLVGGGDADDAHDWAQILGRWGLLSWDAALAAGVRIAALAVMAWALWRAWRPAAETTGGRRAPRHGVQ